MYFGFFVLRFLLISSNTLEDIQKFTIADLNTHIPLLIYIYYERENYSCPYCNIISKQIINLTNIPIRKLNYYEDPYNGARFFSLFFPTIIIYDHKRTHYLEIDNYTKMQKIIDDKGWLHDSCSRMYGDPNKLLVRFYAFTHHIFYAGFRRILVVLDLMPGWFISVVVGIMISSVIIVFVCLIIDILRIKEKED